MNLSVITINFNNADGLKLTMDSVAEQTAKGFEHIIIDGKSNDGSLDIIKSYSYSNLSFIHEEDHGIYNAMNKGVKLAKGKYLLFLNSGDYLSNANILNEISSCFENGFDLIIGNIKTVKDQTEAIVSPPKTINLDYLLTNSLPHPATFYKAHLFEKYGLYNEENKIISDWEFNLKLFVLGSIQYQLVDNIVSVFDLSGISSSAENKAKMQDEGEAAIYRIFGNLVGDFIISNLRNREYKPGKRKKITNFIKGLYKS